MNEETQELKDQGRETRGYTDREREGESERGRGRERLGERLARAFLSMPFWGGGGFSGWRTSGTEAGDPPDELNRTIHKHTQTRTRTRTHVCVRACLSLARALSLSLGEIWRAHRGNTMDHR